MDVPNVVQLEHVLPARTTITSRVLARLIVPLAHMSLLVKVSKLTVLLVELDVLHVRLMEPAKHVMLAVI